jgi:hypothetical protein
MFNPRPTESQMEAEQILSYSNPRLEATIENWPSGQHRTTARFWIETKAGKGQRCLRTTNHPKTGRPSAPKKMVYARKARIVDGSDGRTYIIELTIYHSISVMRGDMQFQQEHIAPEDPRYPAIRALFEEAVQ